jgi:hypothetical protein
MVDAQKNVAFGWLSVMLGNFALLPALSERIQAKQSRKNLRPIIEAIENFMALHKEVDMIEADEDGHSPQAGLTVRLESLVSKLQEQDIAHKMRYT